jgi:FtsH-binding integral membrane protein
MSDNMHTIFSKVFMWLFVGLALTFGVAYAVSTNETMVYNLFSGGKYWIVWIVEFIVVIVLSTRIHKMSLMTATTLFLLYSLLTGLTLSSIFIIYDIMSILWVFGIASGLFLMFGAIGYFTKIDITKIGSILFMFLMGIIIMYLINMFLGSGTIDLALCIISLALFLIFVAFDIQVIKKKMTGLDDENKIAIYGAFQLYIDFINIFLELLRLFGRGRD